ncbi:hypothetical protein B0A49_13785 [Cryomyces minteri]|uniref:BZIP domain-containing protein n=1 Tax=Cryomyces minteri TaxID=331657 RepID=A0A4U0WC51_9PEZI|nr:hypothetical protein B0A49_13785 [Cryomyces minteri]
MDTADIPRTDAHEHASDRKDLSDFRDLSYMQIESQPTTPHFFGPNSSSDGHDLNIAQGIQSRIAPKDGDFAFGNVPFRNVLQAGPSGTFETLAVDRFPNLFDPAGCLRGDSNIAGPGAAVFQPVCVDLGSVSIPLHHTPPAQRFWKAEQQRELSPLDVSHLGESTNAPEQYGQCTPPEDRSFEAGRNGDSSKMTASSDGERQNMEKQRLDTTPPSTEESNGGVCTSKRRRRGSEAVVKSEDPGEGAKRDKFLERNRLAAAKCRQKKKIWTEGLEERGRNAQAHNIFLKAEVATLRNELTSLKGMVLQHVERNCGCGRIREYVGQAVTVLPPSSEFIRIPGHSMVEASQGSGGFAMGILGRGGECR